MPLFLRRAGKLLAAACLLLSALDSAKAQSLDSVCEVGFMDRGVRVVYLIVWALILTLFYHYSFLILWTGLLSYCVLTLFTLIHRVLHIRGQLNR